MRIKCELNFPKPLVFCAFLPEKHNSPLEFSHDKYNILVYLSSKDQLSKSRYPRIGMAEIRKLGNIHCDSLTMEIEVVDCDPEIIEALDVNSPNKKTEEFGKIISNLILDTQNRIIDYFRNIMKQAFLDQVNIDTRHYQGFLHRRNTRFLNSKGEWQELRPAINPHQRIDIIIYKNAVDKDKWIELSEFVLNGRKSKMIDILIANSIRYRSEKNGRMAVVEAVTALEAAIEHLLPRAIMNAMEIPNVTEKELNNFIEKAGLRQTASFLFKILQNVLGINEEDLEQLNKAVDTRNNVIHNQQREVPVETATKYVNVIKSVIEKMGELPAS